ncbi:MAG: MBL fold metallo-hydrolase [Nitrospinota bacterium]
MSLPAGLGIFSFPSPGGSLSRSVNAYLLEGSRPVVIDSGFSADAAGGEAMGSHLTEFSGPGEGGGLLLLTHLHRDHAGGAEELSQKGFEVCLHREETRLHADRISNLHAVRRIEDGETVETPLGRLIALHTPGHSHGHLCFHWPEEGILFSGDLITAEPSSWVGPPEGDMTAYLNSLRRVAELPLRLILSGHGAPVEHPAEAIGAYIERRLEREGEILRLLEKGAARIPDLTTRIYRGRGLSPRLQAFAEKTVEAHLIKLCQEGRVRRSGDDLFSLS